MSIKNAAEMIRQQGRGNDSMLMHVTPGEVQALQGIAQAHGGSLTINPETGLPEASFLQSILPTIAGIGIGFATGNPFLGAAVAGGLGYASSGSLEKGLISGLGAFGGASALGGLAASGATAGAAAGAGAAVPSAAASTTIGTGATMLPPSAMSSAAGIGGSTSYAAGFGALPSTTLAGIPTTAAPGILTDAGASQLLGTSLSPAGYGALPVSQKFAALGQGFSGMGSNFMGGINAMGKGNLLMAGAPLLAGGLGGGSQQPEIPEQESFIRPAVYDPATQRYTRLAPIKSADFGTRSFAQYAQDQGYQEGGAVQQRYQQPTRTVDPAVTEYNRMLMERAQQEYVQGIATPPPMIPQVAQPVQVDGVAAVPEINTTTKRLYDPATQRFSANPNYVDPKPPRPDFLDSRGRRNDMYSDGGEGGFDGFSGFNDMGTGYDYGDDGIGFDDTPTGFDYGDDGLAQGGQIARYAGGGITDIPKFQAGGDMESDAFVVPADVVSGLGDGSTKAGLERLNQFLGIALPIEGEGTGLSDDIPATIEGEQPARVADGEAYIPPEVVARLGGGDPERGAAMLHTMMDKIREAAHGKTTQQREVQPEKVMPT